MSKTNTASRLHQRMIEDMAARRLNPAHLRLQPVRRVAQTFTRYGNARRGAPFSLHLIELPKIGSQQMTSSEAAHV